MVQGSIAGLRGQFVIDTGASSTVISESVAKKLGLEAETGRAKSFGRDIQIKRVSLSEVQLGPRRFTNIPALVVSNLHFIHGIRVDALIGLDFLRRSNLGVDFDSARISLGELVHFEERMSFYNKAPFVMIRMKVSGIPLVLKLDTGAGSDLLLYKERIEGRIEWRRTDETKTIEHMGGRFEAKKLFLKDVTIAGTKWESVPAFLLPIGADRSGTLDGSVGLGALGLSKFRVDFDKGLLSWEK